MLSSYIRAQVHTHENFIRYSGKYFFFRDTKLDAQGKWGLIGGVIQYFVASSKLLIFNIHIEVIQFPHSLQLSL